MPLEKTQGIILKRNDFTETSKMILIYTRDFGKCRFLAKGALRKNSRFTTNLELFNLVEIEFYFKEQYYFILRSFDMIGDNFSISYDPESFIYACAAVQLIDNIIIEGEKNEGLFCSLSDFLKHLNLTGKNKINLYYKFLLHFSDSTGYGINPEKCSKCGKNILSTSVYGTETGFLCGKCLGNNIRSILISRESLKNLKYIAKEDYENLKRLKINKKSRFEIERFFNIYMKYNMEDFRYPEAMKIRKQISSVF